MNPQYVILALAFVAFVGIVAGNPVVEDEQDYDIPGETASQLSLFPGEDENLAQLVEPQTMFTTFCKQAREFVIGKVQDEKSRLKALVFNILMNSGEKLADEISTTMSTSVEQLGDTLRDPSKPIAELEEDADVVSKKLNDAAKRIQDGQNKNDLLSSVFTVASVVLTKAKQVLAEQFNRAKLMVSPDSILLIVDACERLQSEYLAPVTALFKSNHASLSKIAEKEKNTNAIQFLTYFTRVENLKCGITKRLMNLKLFCSIYGPTAPVFQKMLSNE